VKTKGSNIPLEAGLYILQIRLAPLLCFPYLLAGWQASLPFGSTTSPQDMQTCLSYLHQSMHLDHIALPHHFGGPEKERVSQNLKNEGFKHLQQPVSSELSSAIRLEELKQRIAVLFDDMGVEGVALDHVRDFLRLNELISLHYPFIMIANSQL